MLLLCPVQYSIFTDGILLNHYKKKKRDHSHFLYETLEPLRIYNFPKVRVWSERAKITTKAGLSQKTVRFVPV